MTDKVNNNDSKKEHSGKKRSRKDKILTAVIVSLVFLIIGHNVISYYGASIFLPGREFSEITGIDPSNNRNTRIDISTGKTIVNFWATWCNGCLKEVHNLSNISRNVRVVGVLKKPFNPRVFSSLRLSHTNIIADDELFEEMHVSFLPLTVFVVDGVIKKVHTGPVSENTILDWLKDD